MTPVVAGATIVTLVPADCARTGVDGSMISEKIVPCVAASAGSDRARLLRLVEVTITGVVPAVSAVVAKRETMMRVKYW